MAAGYSKRSLVQKLGIKPGWLVAIVDAPSGYDETLGPLPEGVTRPATADAPVDFIQFFTKELQSLEREFPHLKQTLSETGMLWVSWPKRASRVPTDLDENGVREIGLANGLVDVKVAAVDETWSGLKFVYRLRDRTGR